MSIVSPGHEKIVLRISSCFRNLASQLLKLPVAPVSPEFGADWRVDKVTLKEMESSKAIAFYQARVAVPAVVVERKGTATPSATSVGCLGYLRSSSRSPDNTRTWSRENLRRHSLTLGPATVRPLDH
jgi:hypothetical protein